MSAAHRISVLLFCSAMVWATGCAGPLGCGPFGAGACCPGEVNGPVAFGAPCGGCGQCEGCGELYIDPWINEPADCCDPCDRCGNYNGQSCGKCRSVWGGFASMWGYRCEPPCGGCGAATCDGGCDVGCDANCGGCESCYAGTEIGGEVIHITNGPTPAPGIMAAPRETIVVPDRVRRIFKRRPRIAVGDAVTSER